MVAFRQSSSQKQPCSQGKGRCQMSELNEPEEEMTENEEGKDEIMKENLRTRTRRKVGQLWNKHRTIFAMAFMAVLGFLVGANFWAIRSTVLFVSNGFQSPDMSSTARNHPPRKAGPNGCELYPNDPVCKAHRNSEFTGDSSDCFLPKGSKAPKPEDLNMPYGCRRIGPFGILDIEDLRSEFTTDFSPIADVPPSIKPYYESANTQISVKSALVIYLVLSKANGEMREEALTDPSLAPIIQELSLSPDDGLTEDERKTAGQALAIYNAFASLLAKQRTEERQKVAKECTGYADKELVPIRCAFINSPLSAPPASL